MFNLKKYSQKGIEFFDTSLQDLENQVETESQRDLQGIPPLENQSVSEISRSLTDDQEAAAKQATTAVMANNLIAEITKNEHGTEILNRLKSEPSFASFVSQIRRDADPAFLKGFVDDNQIAGLIKEFEQTTDMQGMARSIKMRAEAIARQMNANEKNRDAKFYAQPPVDSISVASFNFKKYKEAQVTTLQNTNENVDFVSKYLPRILSFTGDKHQDIDSERAKEEIIRMCSPAAQEEANSALQRIQSLNSQVGQEEGRRILQYIYDNWVSPAGAQTSESIPMEKTMSQNPKGIIKHDLSNHVLNNQAGLTKTAADHFGNPYILYGPTEKRICPKLRGKGGGQPGSGDVVSEYVCRHHCLDGIVIDDHKTVCGEAIWRSHVMDKFSREYVDEDGNIVGGYLNKRFEIHRDVPEENKMRLKPGETRKPRPPEWGSTEARMQAMRAAEGKKRGYGPDTNTGEPFKWCSDVDQNNVEVSQKERDRRETASGHKIVEYTNKGKQENKPKTSFNLKAFKTAQYGAIGDGLSPKPMTAPPVESPKPMTGPRGPVGPDNPQSDDLGLSPDMLGQDDYNDSLNSGAEFEMSPEAEEIISQISWSKSKNELLNFLNNEMKSSKSGYSRDLNSHDWDEITDAANDHLKQLGEPYRVETNMETFSLIEDQEKDMAMQSQGTPVSPMQSSVAQRSFNLARFKKAQIIPIPEDGKKTEPVDQVIRDPKPMSMQDMETEKFDFAKHEPRIRNMPDDALLYTLKDLDETIEIQEKSSREGYPTPKLGYYHDERHSILQEMKRRGLKPGWQGGIAPPEGNPAWENDPTPQPKRNVSKWQGGIAPPEGHSAWENTASFNLKNFKKANKKVVKLEDKLQSASGCTSCNRKESQVQTSPWWNNPSALKKK